MLEEWRPLSAALLDALDDAHSRVLQRQVYATYTSVSSVPQKTQAESYVYLAAAHSLAALADAYPAAVLPWLVTAFESGRACSEDGRSLSALYLFLASRFTRL